MTTTEGRASLRAAVASGLRWKLAGQLATQGSRIATTLVLARLLLPREFGLAGMVLVFAGVIQVFADLGFSPGIIQYKVITDDDRTTAFWTNVFVGLMLTCLGIAASPFIAHFFGEPMLRSLFMVLSLSFVIGALGSTHGALLTREMRFRELELTAGVAALAGAAVAIAAAVAGAGPWALILQVAVTSATTTVLLWLIVRWVPRLRLSRASLRKLWGFGAGMFGSRVLSYLSRDADNLLVGRFLGAHALGVYSLAYAVVAMPFDRILVPLQSLFAPMFARLQDDVDRTRAAWLRAITVCFALMAPLTTGVAVLAPEFIRVVLGSRWVDAVPVVQVLAYVACLQAATFVTPLVLASQFRTATVFRLAAVSCAAHLTAFAVGLHWGIVGVAVGYALSTTLVAVPLQVAYPARLLRASAHDVAGAVAGIAGITAVMVAAVVAARAAVGLAGGGPAPRLAVAVASGVVVYALLVLKREAHLIADVAPKSMRPLLARTSRSLRATASGA